MTGGGGKGTTADPQRARQLLLCLDGLRYSCAIVDMCHKRALKTLRTFEASPEQGSPTAAVVEVLADVWSIVDATQRVRQLLNQVPLLKQTTPDLVLFMKTTSTVEQLRDYMQHLNQELGKLETERPPLLGAISWVSEDDPLRTLTLMPSNPRIAHSALGLVFAAHEGRYVRRFEMSAGDAQLDVDDVVRRVKTLDDFLCNWVDCLTFSDGSKYEYRPQTVPVVKLKVTMPAPPQPLPHSATPRSP